MDDTDCHPTMNTIGQQVIKCSPNYQQTNMATIHK